MYVEDFNAFYQQAEELLLKDPIRTRYVVKYRHTAGQLVLKVTDDVVVRALRLSSCSAGTQCVLGAEPKEVARHSLPPTVSAAPTVLEVQDGPASGYQEDGEAQCTVLCCHGDGRAAIRCMSAQAASGGSDHAVQIPGWGATRPTVCIATAIT